MENPVNVIPFLLLVRKEKKIYNFTLFCSLAINKLACTFIPFAKCNRESFGILVAVGKHVLGIAISVTSGGTSGAPFCERSEITK